MNDGKPYGNCPVQALAEWRGKNWYFRARGDGWSWSWPWFDDYKDDERWDGAFHYREGEYPNAGWMEHADAEKLIAECLKWAESASEST